jgi:heme A synthase
MCTEGLIGAKLVLHNLVADNASISRAIYMAAHLVNTFLLLAALLLTAWWAVDSLLFVCAGAPRQRG